MVIDRLENLSQYASLHPRFPAAFSFLQGLLEQNAADGHHVMPDADIPDAIYANLMTGDTKINDAAVAESHKKYIDVQVVLSGEENMYVPASVAPAVTVPYQPDKDVIFYESVAFDSCHRLRVSAGSFVIFFANELHAPSMAVGSAPSAVRKAVLKVLV